MPFIYSLGILTREEPLDDTSCFQTGPVGTGLPAVHANPSDDGFTQVFLFDVAPKPERPISRENPRHGAVHGFKTEQEVVLVAGQGVSRTCVWGLIIETSTRF